jgi:hypothetical protein
MPLTVTADERAALEAAQDHSPKVRHWWRYQAVLLRAKGLLVKDVARAPAGCRVWAAPVCSPRMSSGSCPLPYIAGKETAGRACRHTASQTWTGDPPVCTLWG